MPILTTCLTAFREDVLVKRIRRALFRDAWAGQEEGVQLRLLRGGAYHRRQGLEASEPRGSGLKTGPRKDETPVPPDRAPDSPS